MSVPSVSCLRALRALVVHQRSPTCLSAMRAKSTLSKPGSSPAPASSPPPATSKAAKQKESLKEPSREQRKAGPQPLNQPLGLLDPPRMGQNWGVDDRSLKQRRDDFVDHEKHIERRQKLAKTLFRPYFKDFNDMRFYKGKVFLAPERLFKTHFAQYFPNLHGMTLRDTEEDDTTPVLEGQVSVVTVFSSGWAEKQKQGFVGKSENPGLTELLDLGGEGRTGQNKAQLVEINYEPNSFKYWIIKMFQSGLRATRDKSLWGNYFVVRKGFDQDLRLSIGMSNEKVGHVYLVDRKCKIRWAGHAEASEAE